MPSLKLLGSRRSTTALVGGELLFVASYIVAPSAYLLVGIIVAGLYMAVFGRRVGYLMALLQLGLTAGYASQRAMRVVSIAGLAFTPLDVFIMPALVMGLLSIPFLLNSAARAYRIAVGFVVVLLAYIPVPLLMTWIFVPADMSLALRNLRSFVYLLGALAFAAAALRGASRELFVTCVNIAAAGAGLVLLAATVAELPIVGFEETSLVLSDIGLNRVAILDEGLLPVLIAAAFLSALIGRGPVRRSGIVACPLLFTATLISPGRGSIFTSCVVLAAILVCHLVGFTELRRNAVRSVPARLITLSLLAALVVPTLSSAVAALSEQGQDVTVIRRRTADALVPWQSQNVEARYNGWRAGVELGMGSPIVGNGLAHTFPELMSKYRLDSPFNFPSAIANAFAKTGIIGLALWTGLFGSLVFGGLAHWRQRTGTIALAALPMIAAFLIRGLSDDILLSFQTPLVLGVIFAIAITPKRVAKAPEDRLPEAGRGVLSAAAR
jgi:hypothetical protein